MEIKAETIVNLALGEFNITLTREEATQLYNHLEIELGMSAQINWTYPPIVTYEASEFGICKTETTGDPLT